MKIDKCFQDEEITSIGVKKMLKVALTNIDMDNSEEMEFDEMEKEKERRKGLVMLSFNCSAWS